MDGNNQKYFIILRLFKGWEDKLNSFEGCCDLYWSLRYEVRQEDHSDNTNWIETNWKDLHKQIPLESIQRGTIPNDDVQSLMDHLPFDTLLNLKVDRITMLDIIGGLRTTPPVSKKQEDQTEWVNKFKETINKFTETLIY
jgi:hypothetical protein